MRVVLVSFGFAEYCIQQANGLARECEVLLMLPRGDSAEYAHLLHPAVKFVPFDKPRLRQPLRQSKLAVALVRQIHHFRPDVIHYQQGHLWFNLALPLLRKYPLVVTVHDPRYHAGDLDSQRTPQRLMDWGFRRADRIIVHGESLKRQVVELFGFAREKVQVIPHVAIGSVTPPNAAEVTSPSLLFFGRIWPYKGLHYLIKAEPEIRRDMPDVKIVIAGVGDDFEQYRKMIERPENYAIHNYFISADECDRIFRESSVVVLPYTEATQSGVIPLAYSYAKPVIASRVGALEEAVVHGVTGLLVPPANSKALAAAVVELLRDPGRCREMGCAGRNKLDTEWSPQVVGLKAMEVYRRAIADRQAHRQPAAASNNLALEVQDSRRR
jgi:glycosyltransferase involved in cell wall biosynthesis